MSRRDELLHAALAYAAETNISDMSLRPLAAAVGSSPRVLLYLFGSKEGLVREVLAISRVEQRALLDRALEETSDPREALLQLWDWLLDPGHRNLMRLFFEGYVRAVGPGGAWEGYATASLQEWLPVLERVARPRVPATLILGTLRGLLLDLLAGGDGEERTTRAWAAFLDLAFPPGTASPAAGAA